MAIASRARSLIFAFALLSACQPAAPPVDNDLRAIGALRERIAAAENAGQADSMQALVDSDVVVLPPNAAPMLGATAFVDYLRGAFQSLSFAVEYRSQEVEVSGDWGFDRGTFSATMSPRAGGPAISDKGNYLWLARRDSAGQWHYARIIWNAESPPPAPTDSAAKRP